MDLMEPNLRNYVTYDELMKGYGGCGSCGGIGDCAGVGGWESCGPRQGSLIQIHRALYKHWAYYDQNAFCYHITDPDNSDFGSITAASQALPLTSSFKKVKGVIRYAKLEDIMKNSGSQIPSKARVNNLENKAKKMKLEAIDPKVTLDRLKEASEKEMVFDYHPIYRNCKYYVTFWKYKKPSNTQNENV
jgi:hypothetical protein